MDEVRTLMGEPEEIEESEDEDEFEHQAWNYLEEDYSLVYFDREDDLPPQLHRNRQPRHAPVRRANPWQEAWTEIEDLMRRHGYDNPRSKLWKPAKYASPTRRR